MLLTYFNSHPREGGDATQADAAQIYAISILTPARGVTRHRNRGGFRLDISILTPARGVTPGMRGGKDGQMVFQFSPPRGG